MTRTGPSGSERTLRRQQGGCCLCVPIESGSYGVTNQTAALILNGFFPPPMKTVFAELRGDGYGNHIARRSHHRKSLRVRALRVEPLDERKARRLRKPRLRSETQAPFSQFYFGARIRDRRVSLESLWAWIVVISTLHALRLSLQREAQRNGLCSQPTEIAARKTSSNQGAFATRSRSHGRTTYVRDQVTH